jgi:hypothetical protein
MDALMTTLTPTPTPTTNTLVLTAEWLRASGASPDQYAAFAAEWPFGCTVNQANLIRLEQIGLSLKWLASRALPADLYAVYRAKCITLHNNHCAVVAPIFTAYRAKRAALIAGYKAVSGPADTACRLSLAAVQAEYLAAENALRADYLAKRSALLIDVLCSFYDTVEAS